MEQGFVREGNTLRVASFRDQGCFRVELSATDFYGYRIAKSFQVAVDRTAPEFDEPAFEGNRGTRDWPVRKGEELVLLLQPRDGWPVRGWLRIVDPPIELVPGKGDALSATISYERLSAPMTNAVIRMQDQPPASSGDLLSLPGTANTIEVPLRIFADPAEGLHP